MIKEEFLSLKYTGVKKVHEITKSEKTKTDFGWKCRKYIRWETIQKDKNDRQILKTFADELLETGIFNIKYFGAISRMFLNVQRWRLDPQKLSVEVPYRTEWEHLWVLINNAKESQELITSYLDKNRIPYNELNSLDTQNIFYYTILFTFFHKSLPDIVTKSSTKKTLETKDLENTFDEYYKACGTSFQSKTGLYESLKSIYSDIDIELPQLKDILIKSVAVKNSCQIIIHYKSMQRTTLFNIKSLDNNVYVEVNSKNSYVKNILTNELIKLHFEIFLKAYSKAYVDLPNIQDNLDQFNSYLALELESKTATAL